MKKNFFPFIIGHTEKFSLEHRFLNGTLFFSLTLALLVASVNFILELDPVLNIIISSGWIIFTLLYYLSRRRHYYSRVAWIFIVFCMAALPFSWFLNSGLLGSTLYVAIVLLVLFIVIAKGWQKMLVTIMFITEIIAIIIVEYFRPDLVVPYAGRDQQFADITATLLFSLVALSLSIFFIMKNINAERIKAEENNRLKTYFLANISHEIRTPMNGILGFAELLSEKNISEAERIKYLNIIKTSGNHLLKLINDVINISRIEAGHTIIKNVNFNLNLLFSDLRDFFRIHIENEGRSIELKLIKGLEDEESFVLADDIRIRQTLINLLGNACKFTDAGVIEFGYSMQESGSGEPRNLLVLVKDTGIGISDHDRKLIFDIFKQADDSHTRKYGGAGLGLSITRRLVELMGGTIWVESELNKGSAFYFTIPYTAGEKISEPAAEHVQTADIQTAEKGLILIVEDHDDSFRLLRKVLEKNGYTVMRAGNGREAVDSAKQNEKIILILMDIQLPVMNGYEATRAIRLFNKTVPIIAQTGNAFEEDRVQCFEAGCTDFITKPLEINFLLEKISGLLSR